MNNIISCDGIAIKLDNTFSESLKPALDMLEIPYNIEGSKLVLENQRGYFILEDEYINGSERLLSIIDKLAHKNYDNNIFVYRNEDFVEINATADDKYKYNNVVKENIIDGDLRSFNISIDILNEALDKNNTKSVLIIDFFYTISISK